MGLGGLLFPTTVAPKLARDVYRSFAQILRIVTCFFLRSPGVNQNEEDTQHDPFAPDAGIQRMTSPDPHADLTQSGLNLIGQALSIFDADLRLAVWNRPFLDMFALPPPLARRGARFEDIIRHMVARGEYGPQPDPEAAIAERVAQARTFQAHYLERTRPNGQTIAIEGAPLAQGGWVAVYTDITETKRQEALLRARSDALSQQVLDNAERLSAANRELAATILALREATANATSAEARTRQVTEMVPAHIAHIDAEYRYGFSNQQLAHVFPGARDDVVGLSVEEALGPETFARLRPYLDGALSGTPQVFEITHEPSARRIRVALTPDRSGGGTYVLSTDVTAEVQAREALGQVARRTLAAQMTSGMAHDFGNLLTIILGLQDRLAHAGLPESAAQDVQTTLAAARRGVQLLERLSQISGTRDAAPQPTDLAALLGDLVAMARPSLGEGIRLIPDIDLPRGAVLIDHGFLQDTLLNLILNARDAMAGRGEITLSARLAGAMFEITLADTGPGFTPEALRRATEPFFTTKAGQGSGLGLSMAYDQTKLAGGSLRLTNGDRGAVVRLRLPWRPVSPRMVLLVEDDDDLRAGLRRMLTAQGHSVIEAASASEARAMLDLPGIELILSDLQLGDGSGADLVGGSDLPGLVMTALPVDDPGRAGLRGPVLTKPFGPAALAAAIDEVFHG